MLRRTLSIRWSNRGDWSNREPPKVAEVRKGRGYGVSATSPETARMRWKKRTRMLEAKMKLCDITVFLSISGLILAMIDAEIEAVNMNYNRIEMYSMFSFLLRVVCLLLTFLLLLSLIAYHYTETKIYLIETGSEHWRIGVTRERLLRVLLELAVCSICPIPDSGSVEWPLLGADPIKTRQRIRIPVQVLICIPMFLRLYLLCRFVVLHSSQYKDCATRTIASLNHIGVDFGFVAKSQLYTRPLHMLSCCTLCFWLIVAWMLTQCERYAFPGISGYQHFFDYLWFEIITFFSIGYGDIQVQTYCGRGLAMLTAIVGTLFSSTLIALVGRRLALSSSEKRVNHLIAENQMNRDHKDAAARVLQNTWRTVLRRREFGLLGSSSASIRLTNAQRGLLRAVLSFRKTRWRLRMQMEDEDDYFTARRAFMETEERLTKVRLRQQQLDTKLGILFENVENLTGIVQKRI